MRTLRCSSIGKMISLSWLCGSFANRSPRPSSSSSWMVVGCTPADRGAGRMRGRVHRARLGPAGLPGRHLTSAPGRRRAARAPAAGLRPSTRVCSVRPGKLPLTLVPLCAFVLAVSTACTGSAPPAAVGGRDTTQMVLAQAAEPASLNPLLGYGDGGAAKIFDGLVEHDANGAVHPQLAAELPQVSADGRSWTVALRP